MLPTPLRGKFFHAVANIDIFPFFHFFFFLVGGNITRLQLDIRKMGSSYINKQFEPLKSLNVYLCM